MYWTELMFGRHYDKTLPQVVFADPDYFFWGIEERVFDRHGLRDEARFVCQRATHIRIPQRAGEKLVAEYTFCCSDGRFANVELVPESRPLHQGSSPTFRLPVFNLHVTRTCCTYDKAGGKALVKALKRYLFGDPDYRLTKEHCERFFDDDVNFVLPATSRGSGVAEAARASARRGRGSDH